MLNINLSSRAVNVPVSNLQGIVDSDIVLYSSKMHVQNKTQTYLQLKWESRDTVHRDDCFSFRWRFHSIVPIHFTAAPQRMF